jgi:tetratricopeptide (TPR) repeat protein
VQKKTYSYQYFKDFFSDLTEDDLKAEAVINQCKIIESKQYNLQSASETVSSQKEMTTLIEDALIKYPNYENLRSYGSETYGNLGWLYIQTSQFKEAEKAIRKGIEMDKDSQNEWLYAFLAHALLFQDKYQAAQKIYLEMKDKPDINGTYKNGFLREFELLENNGVTHKDVAKIRELLK